MKQGISIKKIWKEKSLQKKKTSVKPKRYLDVRYTLTHTKKKKKWTYTLLVHGMFYLSGLELPIVNCLNLTDSIALIQTES